MMRHQLIPSLLVITILASAFTAVVLTAGAIPSAAILEPPVQIVIYNETVSPSPTPTPTPSATPTPTVNPIYPVDTGVKGTSPIPSPTVKPTPTKAAAVVQDNADSAWLQLIALVSSLWWMWALLGVSLIALIGMILATRARSKDQSRKSMTTIYTGGSESRGDKLYYHQHLSGEVKTPANIPIPYAWVTIYSRPVVDDANNPGRIAGYGNWRKLKRVKADKLGRWKYTFEPNPNELKWRTYYDTEQLEKWLAGEDRDMRGQMNFAPTRTAEFYAEFEGNEQYNYSKSKIISDWGWLDNEWQPKHPELYK